MNAKLNAVLILYQPCSTLMRMEGNVALFSSAQRDIAREEGSKALK
jgi:hypothetical protein